MINQDKLKGLKTANELLDTKYGKEGTESRTEFNEKAQAWYYASIVQKEVDRLWADGRLNDEIVSGFKTLHERTAYK